jgi:hypothetical protein
MLILRYSFMPLSRTVLLKTTILAFAGFTSLWGNTQRIYKDHSVLQSGNWFKVAVGADGIYKLDVSFLNSLGIAGSIPSGQLRVYSGGAGMVPESNSAPRVDDLEELAIQVNDGGDGQLNGSDYALFYGQGPHIWKKDSANQRFSHIKNLYAEKTWYFITVGGSGRRISQQAISTLPTLTVTSYDERIQHELDTVNLLASGQQWFGEEFSNLPGHQLSRQFTIPSGGILPAPVTLVTNVVSRSVNAAGRFDVLLNNQLVHQHFINPVGGGINDLFAQQSEKETVLPAQSSLTITFNYFPGSFNAQGWLNWFEIFFRRQLSFRTGEQLLFRDWQSTGNTAALYKISNADASTQVWDVTDPFNPVRQQVSISGSEADFVNSAQYLHEYAAFGNAILLPEAGGKVPDQDLHNTSDVNLLIVTNPAFISQAQRLAKFHLDHDGISSVVVTTDQVYNEFGGGAPDPSAIRDFARMYYDRYRSTWTGSGKYLLLFGRGSFDYKDRVNGNTNYVTAYESASSLDPLSSYTSDDFFGFLDDQEDVNSSVIINTLDIGIGRLPVRNAEEANNFVAKLLAYHSPAAQGPWRNNANFVADDEDFNLHLQDAEVVTATAASVAPVMNISKIYLDAFRQEGGTAGGTYPQANAAINNNIYNGTLIWNYSGHGGPPRLAEETILDQQIVNSFNNAERLPLFITATCDFAPYDHPGTHSLGENLLVRPATGAIALMTTTRVVFAFSNRILNNNYLQIALQPDANGKYKSLGEAMLAAKNYTYLNSSDIINNRKFTLLGDPAMTLAFPKLKVRPLLVNGTPVSVRADTLSATESASIDGEVTDNNGVKLNDFNGTVYLTLFDKPQSIMTLGNDPTSIPVAFQSQTNALFKGKVSATNGNFNFRFRLPKDINYQYGNGKLSLYAGDTTRDAGGYSTNVIIGGIAPGALTDKEGPVIKAFLNDKKFVNGSIVNGVPVLIIDLSDSSGINTGNAGIDHDIVATIDGDSRKYFVLNDFYETDLNSYQKGTARFQLPAFTPGHHTITIKAWDVMNNSSEYQLEFSVINDGELVIGHVLNYPNPFTTNTTFWFEHNKPGVDLKVRIDIYAVSGKIIKTISETINNEGNRSIDIHWDGRDNYGDRVGRGVYLYRLSVETADGKKASKLQRLVSLF